MDISFFDLLLEFGDQLDTLLAYLTDLLGSETAAEQAIINEDLEL